MPELRARSPLHSPPITIHAKRLEGAWKERGQRISPTDHSIGATVSVERRISLTSISPALTHYTHGQPELAHREFHFYAWKMTRGVHLELRELFAANPAVVFRNRSKSVRAALRANNI